MNFRVLLVVTAGIALFIYGRFVPTGSEAIELLAQVALVLTLIVVLWYTTETQKLRESSQRTYQLERKRYRSSLDLSLKKQTDRSCTGPGNCIEWSFWNTGETVRGLKATGINHEIEVLTEGRLTEWAGGTECWIRVTRPHDKRIISFIFDTVYINQEDAYRAKSFSVNREVISGHGAKTISRDEYESFKADADVCDS